MPRGYQISQHSLYLLGKNSWRLQTNTKTQTTFGIPPACMIINPCFLVISEWMGKESNNKLQKAFLTGPTQASVLSVCFYVEGTSEDEGKCCFFSLKRPLWYWAQYHRQYILSSFCTWPHSLQREVTCCDAVDQDERKRHYCHSNIEGLWKLGRPGCANPPLIWIETVSCSWTKPKFLSSGNTRTTVINGVYFRFMMACDGVKVIKRATSVYPWPLE